MYRKKLKSDIKLEWDEDAKTALLFLMKEVFDDLRVCQFRQIGYYKRYTAMIDEYHIAMLVLEPHKKHNNFEFYNMSDIYFSDGVVSKVEMDRELMKSHNEQGIKHLSKGFL